MRLRAIWVLLLTATAASCGEVYQQHLVGPYDLAAIDTEEQTSVYYRLSDGNGIGRIEPTVFSVGWNDRYIVAEQHPGNNKAVINYFYLDMTKDNQLADPAASVTGPLIADEFSRKAAELHLPRFRLTLQSLE